LRRNSRQDCGCVVGAFFRLDHLDFTIALINHFGIRLASLVNDFSVAAEILGAVFIGSK
jgi:hypothetical protein